MAVVKIDAQSIIFRIILCKILSVSVLYCVHSISDYVDFKSAVEDYSLLPFCELSNDSEASMNILEHLEVGREREEGITLFTVSSTGYEWTTISELHS